ncbi:MAG TPA: hypothetical protein VIK30_04360 [Polyangia bacterium]
MLKGLQTLGIWSGPSVVGWVVIALVGCAAKPSSRSPDRSASPALAAAGAGAAGGVGGSQAGGVPKTSEGCRACNGDFGVHGLDPTPRCLCRTRDAGKRCRAKDDCDGECIGDAGEHEVTDRGPPRRGYLLGRCAEFRTSFGCHRFLGRRRDQSSPVNLDEPQPELCVD